jgi:hypothetical protein
MVVAFDKCCAMIENLAYAAWIAQHHALGSEEIVAISEHTARLAAGLRLAVAYLPFRIDIVSLFFANVILAHIHSNSLAGHTMSPSAERGDFDGQIRPTRIASLSATRRIARQ